MQVKIILFLLNVASVTAVLDLILHVRVNYHATQIVEIYHILQWFFLSTYTGDGCLISVFYWNLINDIITPMQRPVIIDIKCTWSWEFVGATRWSVGATLQRRLDSLLQRRLTPLPHAVFTGNRGRACVCWQGTRLKGKYRGFYSGVRQRCHASSRMLLCPCVNSRRSFPREISFDASRCLLGRGCRFHDLLRR